MKYKFAKYNGGYWLYISTIEELNKLEDRLYSPFHFREYKKNFGNGIFINEVGGYHHNSIKDDTIVIESDNFKFPE